MRAECARIDGRYARGSQARRISRKHIAKTRKEDLVILVYRPRQHMEFGHMRDATQRNTAVYWNGRIFLNNSKSLE